MQPHLRRAGLVRLGGALSAAFVAGFAHGDEVLDGLRANQSALRESMGTIELSTTASVGGTQTYTSRSTHRWAVRDDDAFVADLLPNGSPRSCSLTQNGRFYTYESVTMVSPSGSKKAFHITRLRNAAMPLDALQFGVRPAGEWYGDLLEGGDFHVVDRSMPDLIEVSGTTSRNSLYHAWLKPSAGYLAIRTTFKGPQASESEFVVTRWTQRKNAFVPLEGVLVVHDSSQGGTTTRTEMRTTSLRVGTVPIGSMELPQMVPGTILKDDVAGRTWEIGPSGERLDRGAVGPAEPESSAPTKHGWFFVMVVGATLFGSGVLTRRKLGRNVRSVT